MRLRAEFYRRTVIENPWVPVNPHPRQQAFLTQAGDECLFGGAAGGGKSVGILAAALQFATVPGYSALLLRRTFQDLMQPGALIPLSHQWLQGTAAKWDSRSFRWHLPDDVTLSFGYLDGANDVYRYQGAAYQFVGYDELTQFEEWQYRYLFSRLRKPGGMNCLLRMRATSNPGGIGHEWVRRYFLDERRPFIPAKLEHNPSLDRKSYEGQLDRLDPVTRAQLRNGDWNVRPEGNLFKRTWFDHVSAVPPLRRVVRAWDLAASAATGKNDPDYTAGAKMGIADDGTAYLLDLVHFRGTSREVEKVVTDTAGTDGRGVSVRIEQEPGSSGKALVAHYQIDLLPGFDCRGVPATGDKVTRSLPFSAACERKGVKLTRGEWVTGFLDELCAFPKVDHDDRVDAAVNAYADLTGGTLGLGNLLTGGTAYIGS